MLISGLKSNLLILLQWLRTMIRELPHFSRGDKKLYSCNDICFVNHYFPNKTIKEIYLNSRYLITDLS